MRCNADESRRISCDAFDLHMVGEQEPILTCREPGLHGKQPVRGSQGGGRHYSAGCKLHCVASIQPSDRSWS